MFQICWRTDIVILVIDVGNTNVTLGVYDGEELKAYLPHDDQNTQNL